MATKARAKPGAPTAALAERTVRARPIGAKGDPVLIPVEGPDLGWIRVQVVGDGDDEEQPLPAMPYRVEGEGRSYSGKTDAQGVIRHDGVPFGTFVLTVEEPDGDRTLAHRFRVPAVESRDDVYVAPIRERGVVAVQVVESGPEERPAAGVWYRLEGSGAAFSGVTDGEGRIRHRRVRHGSYRLSFPRRGDRPFLVPSLDDASEPYVVRLPERATVRVEVLDGRTERPVADAPYEVTGQGERFEGLTGPDGRIEHGDVPFGDYELKVQEYRAAVVPAVEDADEAYPAWVRPAR